MPPCPPGCGSSSSSSRSCCSAASGPTTGWSGSAPAWGREWIDASEHSDYWLTLDAAGLKALTADLDAVIERYVDAPPPVEGPVEHVAVILHAFPRTGVT